MNNLWQFVFNKYFSAFRAFCETKKSASEVQFSYAFALSRNFAILKTISI